jgi:hypothetical protein
MVNQNLLGCFLSGQHLHGTRLYSSGLTGARALYRRKLLWFSASSEAGCRDSSRSVHPTFRPDQPWFSASGRASFRDSFLFHESQVTSHPSLSPLECAVLDKYRVLPGFGRSCPYVTPLECADAKKRGGVGLLTKGLKLFSVPGAAEGFGVGDLASYPGRNSIPNEHRDDGSLLPLPRAHPSAPAHRSVRPLPGGRASSVLLEPANPSHKLSAGHVSVVGKIVGGCDG